MFTPKSHSASLSLSRFVAEEADRLRNLHFLHKGSLVDRARSSPHSAVQVPPFPLSSLPLPQDLGHPCFGLLLTHLGMILWRVGSAHRYLFISTNSHCLSTCWTSGPCCSTNSITVASTANDCKLVFGVGRRGCPPVELLE